MSQTLECAFKGDFYLEKFTEGCIKNFLNKLHVSKAVEVCHTLGNDRLKFEIQCCLKKDAPVLTRYLLLKDKINKMLNSNLIHKFKCNICHDIYYGKTKRHFKVRACEHLTITPLTGKKVKSPKESAAFDHIVHKGQSASFDDFETLVKECENSSSESHF